MGFPPVVFSFSLPGRGRNVKVRKAPVFVPRQQGRGPADKKKGHLILQSGVPLDCRKTPVGFSDKLGQSAARIICPHGDKFHTCSLRSVFCQVHAPAENVLGFLCRHWRQTLRGFFNKLKGHLTLQSGVPLLICNYLPALAT